MGSRQNYTPHIPVEKGAVPFDSVSEAWFWFVKAQEAKNEGARFAAGQGAIIRPCEPIDILRVVDRLHRNRRLLRDHLLVLRHYGRRELSPDPRRAKEAQAYKIWTEALERMEPILERKGIVHKKSWIPHNNWHEDVFIFDGVAAE